MRLPTLVILLFQVTQLESLNNVSGYLGASVTLPSGGNPTWSLSVIKWSIFLNNTWIATYISGKKNTERIIQYKGRLSLNISSGDLTIHNLTKDDATEYTVDLINTEKQSIVNKIKLTVTQPLQKPNISNLESVPVKGGCWTTLRCVSTDEGVDFSWQVNSTNVTVFSRNNSDDPGLHLVILNSKQIHVQFTCISRRNKERALRSHSLKCDVTDVKPEPHPCCRDRCGLQYFFAVVVGVLGIVVLYLCRGKIKAAWECLREKLCSSNESSQS